MSAEGKFQEPDELQIYFGTSYQVNPYISIRQPTLGEVLEMGEGRYFSMIHTLTALPCNLKAELDMQGIDYEKISEFDLFSMLFTTMNIEDSRILFGDLDPQSFKREWDTTHDRPVLIRQDMVVIDELIAARIRNYLCKMHNITQVREKAMNAATKKLLIEIAYEDLEKRKRKSGKSGLQPLISTMVNSAGFKYDLQKVRDLTLCAFMDSVARIQLIDSSKALLQGCYSGSVDMSKVDKTMLDYARELKK